MEMEIYGDQQLQHDDWLDNLSHSAESPRDARGNANQTFTSSSQSIALGSEGLRDNDIRARSAG
jgi:hypothetical protein